MDMVMSDIPGLISLLNDVHTHLIAIQLASNADDQDAFHVASATWNTWREAFALCWLAAYEGNADDAALYHPMIIDDSVCELQSLIGRHAIGSTYETLPTDIEALRLRWTSFGVGAATSPAEFRVKPHCSELRAVISGLTHLRTRLRLAMKSFGIEEPSPRAQLAVPDHSEGEKPKPGRANRVPLAEAEIRVRGWLIAHAKDDPFSIRRDAVAAGIGVSAGTVSNTAAWKAFRTECKAKAKPVARVVPLTDAMQVVVPGRDDTSDVLDALIEEQQADEARESRRHGPS